MVFADMEVGESLAERSASTGVRGMLLAGSLAGRMMTFLPDPETSAGVGTASTATGAVEAAFRSAVFDSGRLADSTDEPRGRRSCFAFAPAGAFRPD
uniref:Uncharacterized protein n=1 Tax=Mycolicibacterium mucogenicum DSM 44124 TaxID=1226753 RepID=A0A8H2JIY6_MYCMU